MRIDSEFAGQVHVPPQPAHVSHCRPPHPPTHRQRKGALGDESDLRRPPFPRQHSRPLTIARAAHRRLKMVSHTTKRTTPGMRLVFLISTSRVHSVVAVLRSRQEDTSNSLTKSFAHKEKGDISREDGDGGCR